MHFARTVLAVRVGARYVPVLKQSSASSAELRAVDIPRPCASRQLRSAMGEADTPVRPSLQTHQGQGRRLCPWVSFAAQRGLFEPGGITFALAEGAYQYNNLGVFIAFPAV